MKYTGSDPLFDPSTVQQLFLDEQHFVFPFAIFLFN